MIKNKILPIHPGEILREILYRPEDVNRYSLSAFGSNSSFRGAE